MEEPKNKCGEQTLQSGPFSHHKDGRDRNVIWGLTIMSAGIILLMNVFGTVSWDFWNHVWGFWPVILIMAGIRAILGRNFLSDAVLFVLTVAFLGIIIIYGLGKTDPSLIDGLPENLKRFVDLLTNKLSI